MVQQVKELPFSSSAQTESALGAASDVTRGKLAEIRVNESEQRVKLLAEHSRTFSWEVNAEGLYTYVTDVVEQVLGYKPSELINKLHFYDFHPEDDKETFRATGLEVFGKKELFLNLENSALTKTGELVWLNTNGIPIINNEGVLSGYKGNDTDITARMQAEKELQESELRFAVAIEGSGAGIWDWDMQNNKVVFSEQWKEMLGYEDHEVENSFSGWKNLWHPDDVESIEKAISEHLAGISEKYEVIHRCRHKDESWRWFITRGKILRNSSGAPYRWIGTNIDITELKEAEKEQRQSEERYRVITDQSPIAIELYDENGLLVSVNPACLEMFGVEDIAKISKFSLFDDPNITTELKDELRQGKSVRYEVLFDFDRVNELNLYTTSKSGQIALDVIITTIIHDGVINGYLVQIQDCTERRQAAEALVIAKEAAEESNRLKSSFLSNMSHELRTPLNGVLGFSEILRGQLQDSASRDMANMIYESGNRLLKTLDIILDLSRIEANKQDIHWETVDVNKLLSEVVTLFAPLAEKKGLTLTFLVEIPKLFIRADSHILWHIFNELIGNALKYTDAGSIRVYTHILDTKGSSELAITVNDTGIGISKEHQATAFESFRQVSEGWDRMYEGTGLGLSICKKYATLLGGDIVLDSDLGGGSRFSLVLPAHLLLHAEQAVHLLPNVEQDTNQAEKTQSPLSQASHIAANLMLPHVLLVDDDEMCNALVTQIMLNVAKIDFATTGKEALMRLKNRAYDAVLLDINLKLGINGIAVLAAIRKLPDYDGIPIIALTAYAMQDEKATFLAQGFTDYLSKPFSIMGLSTIVRKWITK